MGSNSMEGLIALTDISNTMLPPALRPEPLLMLSAQRPNGTIQLRVLLVQSVGRHPRFRRVLVGQVVAGLKATERGLLSGHTPGIGESSAGELLCGSSSIGI